MGRPNISNGLRSCACNGALQQSVRKRVLLSLFACFVFASIPLPLETAAAQSVGASTSHSQAEDFSQAKFERAQREGRIILVETYADWCAPCQIQAPIVERLRVERRYRGLVLLRINEDTPREVWKELGLAGYGQFIVFRGETETGRGSPLSEAEMRALLSG